MRSTVPRTSRYRYGCSGSLIDSATSGWAVTFLYFCRIVVFVKRTCSPSQANHIGLTCGFPSGRTVARWAYSGRSSRSRWLSGITLINAPFTVRGSLPTTLSTGHSGQLVPQLVELGDQRAVGATDGDHEP